MNSSRPGGNTVKGTGRAGCYAQVAAACDPSDAACISTGDQNCDTQFGTYCDAGTQPPAGDNGTVCGNSYLSAKTAAAAYQAQQDYNCETVFDDACIACPVAGSCDKDSDCSAAYDKGATYCRDNQCVTCTDSRVTCPSGQTCDSYSGVCAAQGDCPGDESLNGDGTCACGSNQGQSCASDGCSVWDCDGVTCDSSGCSSGGGGGSSGGGGSCGQRCGICGTEVLLAGDTDCTCIDPCTPSCGNGSCTVPSDCGPDWDCDGGCCTSPPDDGGGGGGDPGGLYEYCSDPGDSDDPIVIDLSGSGFLLTSAENGVKFNFSGNGPVQLAWTAAGANVGWLALDRNGNGVIDNGAELFSNLSPQPASGAKNGFKALAVYDQPASGGNRDGWITAKDAIFSKLRIWVDKNHDGISQPSELLTLQQAGVKAISVQYAPSTWTDAYGNQFRYRGQIVWEKPVNGQATAAIYDVILTTAR